MELALGRRLKKNEDVHHKNCCRQDFRRKNLLLIDHSLHGFVSSKQAFWVLVVIEAREREQWEAYRAGTVQASYDAGTDRDCQDCSFESPSFGVAEAACTEAVFA
jgi:hypothetical protein